MSTTCTIQNTRQQWILHQGMDMMLEREWMKWNALPIENSGYYGLKTEVNLTFSCRLVQ